MPLSQPRSPPPLSHSSRQSLARRPAPCNQPMSTFSPNNSAGSTDTLAEDPQQREWGHMSSRPSTRLGDVSGLDDVPIPWAESRERAAPSQSPIKHRRPTRYPRPSTVRQSHRIEPSADEDLPRIHFSGLNESRSSLTHSPAVTNLSLDPPASPSLAHIELECEASFSSKRRHSKFYLSDTLVALEVDGCVFQVHRYFLQRESIYLQALFEHDPTAGTSDENSIVLTNITVLELECFLHFLYHGVFEPHRYTIEDWLDLLGAATILKCPSIRQRAISELESPAFAESMDAMERIFIARKYDVAAWLSSAYVDLCVREEALREQEIELVGGRLASQLCGIRERLLLESLTARQQSGSHDSERALRKSTRRARQLIEEIIGIPSSLN